MRTSEQTKNEKRGRIYVNSILIDYANLLHNQISAEMIVRLIRLNRSMWKH